MLRHQATASRSGPNRKASPALRFQAQVSAKNRAQTCRDRRRNVRDAPGIETGPPRSASSLKISSERDSRSTSSGRSRSKPPRPEPRRLWQQQPVGRHFPDLLGRRHDGLPEFGDGSPLIGQASPQKRGRPPGSASGGLPATVMATRPGFRPGKTGPKPVVIPFHHRVIRRFHSNVRPRVREDEQKRSGVGKSGLG